GPAVRWLETMASDDPKVVLDFAEHRWKEESGRRDAIAAVRRASGLKTDAGTKERLDRLNAAIDAEAGPKARAYLAAIRANTDPTWVDGFLAFRDDFACADAALETMTAFDALRAEHDPPAQKALGAARDLFRQGRRDEGFSRAKEVVEKYYASSSYRLAKQ